MVLDFAASAAPRSGVLTVLVALLLAAFVADIALQYRPASRRSGVSLWIDGQSSQSNSTAPGFPASTPLPGQEPSSSGAPAAPSPAALPPLLNPEDPVEATVWNYTATLRRAPPPGFEAWVKFATERSCRLDLAAYRFIEEDLAPFRERPVTPEAVLASYRKLSHAGLVTVRDHQVSLDPGTSATTSFYFSQVQQYAAFLSDLDLIINVLDNSRVYWPEPLPAELQQRLDAGQIDVVGAFREHGCRATPALEKWHDNYAFAIAPTVDQSMVHELAPVASFCKIAGCFADIRVPNHYNQQHSGQCAPGGSADVPWSQKWTTAESVRKFQRSRLVAWGRAKNSSLYDFGFVAAEVQGQPYGDIPLEVNGGALSGRVTPESFYRYKYLLVIDGNAQSGRTFWFLCSSSLAFLVEGMVEWYYQLLEPWVHYIPVALDLSDLEKNVQWAIDHDEEAQAIVRRANEVMAAFTRTQDMECYWYRFLLEYAQLNNITKPAVPAAT